MQSVQSKTAEGKRKIPITEEVAESFARILEEIKIPNITPHIQVLWRADKYDNASDRSTLAEKKLYKKGPEEIGIFATVKQ